MRFFSFLLKQRPGLLTIKLFREFLYNYDDISDKDFAILSIL